MEALIQELTEARRALERAVARLADNASLVAGALTSVERAIGELRRAEMAGRRVP